MTVIRYLMLALLVVMVLALPVYDAGMKVLVHYAFGKGKDMELKSRAVSNSPVILKALSNRKVGESRVVRFKQKEDWRLSYAINGFTLKKLPNGFEGYQYIKFDRTGDVYTYVHTPFGNIKLYDNWVHFIPCTPFKLRFRYENINRKAFVTK